MKEEAGELAEGAAIDSLQSRPFVPGIALHIALCAKELMGSWMQYGTAPDTRKTNEFAGRL